MHRTTGREGLVQCILQANLCLVLDKHYGQVVKFRLLALEIRPYGKLDRVEPPRSRSQKVA